ncbi:MAG: ATPase, partial [Planctomycetes bacterium]|nr:ATPase [Planctomycetota bacterium]
MPAPRPLYGLPELAGADTIVVVEGEKTADSAQSIGFTATTPSFGPASKTDWTPLAGKQIVILPDNDEEGRQRAADVAAELAKLTPAPAVKVVELPDLPEHGDVVDWIDAHGEAAEPEDLRRQVVALADAVAAVKPDRPAATLERFQPFPVDALPEP